MSVNHLMHPRNIYKKPPNFVKLALDFPEFRNHIKQDLSGKVTVNFKEREAVLELTKALLQSDFGLSLELPCDRLVPTLPLRLNYILWLEDLLQLKPLNRKESIHGIDIGTGAACIYPLLAAKKNNWKMLATEIDGVSVANANLNVATNKLNDFIVVKQVSNNSLLLDVVGEEDDFDFCMCNPPFFSSEEELECSPERQPPRNAPSGSKSELIAPGGEVAFVKRIIDDSVKLGTKVRVYTVMLGRKSSLKHLRDYLQQVQKLSPLVVGTTEFCQGHTTRWGLAWSFVPGVVLQDLVKMKKKNEKKKKNPVVVNLSRWTLEDAVTKLTLLFKDLEFLTRIIKETGTSLEMRAIANKNTWSHQRRKRRADKRLQAMSAEEKRKDVENNDGISCKKIRFDDVSKAIENEIIKSIETPGSDINKKSESSVLETKILIDHHASASDSFGLTTDFKAQNGVEDPVESNEIISVKRSECKEEEEEKVTDCSRTNSGSLLGASSEKKLQGDRKEPCSNVDDVEKNEGVEDFMENKWSDIKTLPLLAVDVLLEKSEQGVMIALSLADGCSGGWELVQQVRQIIMNKLMTH